MKIVKPEYFIEQLVDGNAILKNIERAGRTCYKSENKIDSNSAAQFVKMVIKRGHETVLEHEKITVRVICDRGVSHEIVRHRIASYSQESTRYCNYSKDKFGKEIQAILPYFWSDGDNIQKFAIWEDAMNHAEKAYNKLIELGASPQEARSVLPNSLKTEIVITMNLREWRHFFRLRTSANAHPQMIEIALPMLEEFKKRIPVVFDDIGM
jgi:thymidylate synthase (FAD)